MNSNFS